MANLRKNDAFKPGYFNTLVYDGCGNRTSSDTLQVLRIPIFC